MLPLSSWLGHALGKFGYICDQFFHHTSSGLLRLAFQTVLTCPIFEALNVSNQVE